MRPATGTCNDAALRYSSVGGDQKLVGAVQQIGILALVLSVDVFLAAANDPELRRWRFALAPLAIPLVIDSPFLVFPTMFLPVARMFAPLCAETGAPREQPEDQALDAPLAV